MTNTAGTIAIEFIPSVLNGVYAITNRKEVAGNRVFHFLTSLEKKGAFEGRVSMGEHRSANFIGASRKERFVAYAESQGFKIEVGA